MTITLQPQNRNFYTLRIEDATRDLFLFCSTTFENAQGLIQSYGNDCPRFREYQLLANSAASAEHFRQRVLEHAAFYERRYRLLSLLDAPAPENQKQYTHAPTRVITQ